MIVRRITNKIRKYREQSCVYKVNRSLISATFAVIKLKIKGDQ